MNKNRPLDIRQLQAFAKLCSTNSFTTTARHLHVTQSAVSHSIRNLEEEVGCKLLNKKGKKILLTPAGERLLGFARPFLAE
ncbi:MAG: LysR family transcriptional regulator, partial [Opitutales bacterium]